MIINNSGKLFTPFHQSETDRNARIYEILRARHGSGTPLSVDTRQFMEKSFGYDLSAVRIHQDAAAAELTSLLKADALACKNDVFFAPGRYNPHTKEGLWLLAHELTHTIQQRGGTVAESLPKNISAAALEEEADNAAFAVVEGRRVVVAPREDCPEILPAAPFIWALMAVALGFGAYQTFGNDKDVKEDYAQKTPHLYETGWGYIPFVGSVDQVLNGRTAVNRGIGTVFLILDISLGGAVIKGIAFSLRGAARVALNTLKNGGGTTAAREAFQELVAKGFQSGTRTEIARKIVRESRKGPIAIAGEESYRNHSVTYIIKDGRIWKMHGGPAQLFLKDKLKKGTNFLLENSKERSVKEIGKITRRLNSVSIHRVEAAAAKSTLEFWEKQVTRNSFKLFLEAEGCGSSQVLLLQKLGITMPGSTGFQRYAPLFPLFLHGGRIGEAQVLHRVVNPFFMATGTASQLGAWTAIRAIPWRVNREIINDQLKDMNILSTNELFGASREKPITALQGELVPYSVFSNELEYGAPYVPLNTPLIVEVPEAFAEKAAASQAAAAPHLPHIPPKPLLLQPMSPEEKVYSQMDRIQPRTIDQIARQTGMSQYEVSRIMESLQRQGIVQWTQVNSDSFGYVKVK